jgi:hypothetical protein
LEKVREPCEVNIQRIDAKHANPQLIWEEMGQPEYLTEKDVEQLQEASLLEKERQPLTYKDGMIFLKTDLPPHAVSAITITLGPN